LKVNLYAEAVKSGTAHKSGVKKLHVRASRPSEVLVLELQKTHRSSVDAVLMQCMRDGPGTVQNSTRRERGEGKGREKVFAGEFEAKEGKVLRIAGMPQRCR
jgi:hypothetical protein